MKNLEEYKTKLEQMSGFELREEEERLRRTYGGKNWTSEEWAEIKEIVQVFLDVQNARGEKLSKKYKQKFKPRKFVGFLR